MAIHNREECSQCAGDGELHRNGEDIVSYSSSIKRQTARYYEYARKALALVRVYRAECVANGWTGDSRITLGLDTVRGYRGAIAYHRSRAKLAPHETYARCVACKGTGLAHLTCEGCGADVDYSTLNTMALEYADVLVHQSCDTGAAFFETHPAHVHQGENHYASREMREWRSA